MHPDIQKKAQAELDAVVGPKRLPDYGDYDSLPYIRAILLESTRWIPVIPLGIPHSVSQDDYYNGYFIPKGTVVVPVRYFVFSIYFTVSLFRCCSLERVVRIACIYYRVKLKPLHTGPCSGILLNTLIRRASTQTGS